MLPQSGFFGKWKRARLLFVLGLGGVLLTAVMLVVSSQSTESSYLPVVIASEGTPTLCSVRFAGTPYPTHRDVLITGESDTVVSIVNLTTGETMGTDRLVETTGYDCPGFADYSIPYQLSSGLILGDELEAQSDDGSADMAVVSFDLSATPPAPDLRAAAIMTTAPPPPLPSPTPSATSDPNPFPISGVVYRFQDGFTPQSQALVQLIEVSTGQVVAMTDTDAEGGYAFTNLPSAFYHLQSCVQVENQTYYGYRTGVSAPQDLVYISLLARPCLEPLTPTPIPTYPPTATAIP